METPVHHHWGQSPQSNILSISPSLLFKSLVFPIPPINLLTEPGCPIANLSAIHFTPTEVFLLSTNAPSSVFLWQSR